MRTLGVGDTFASLEGRMFDTLAFHEPRFWLTAVAR
jgi:hypothetical protein